MAQGRATPTITNGNLMQIRHTGPGATVLAEVNYTYDPVNNRLTRTDAAPSSAEPAGTETLTYGTANELLNLNATTYGYDLNGNRIQKTETVGSTTYAYDDENRLIRVETTGGLVITYTYDPLGRRIEKNANRTITRYLYDREDILLEYNESGTVTARYIHGPGIDEPLAMEKNGQMYYYHAAALGSIIALTDSAGAVVERYQYDAFGNIMSGTPAVTQPYIYTAREYDPEIGLYYYRARYYDPKVGRFLQRDPIGFAGGDANLYVYVRNDPENVNDPSGKIGQEIEMAVKMGLPLVFGGLDVATDVPNQLGPAYDVVALASGVSGVFTAEIIAATSPSAPLILPVLGAAISGIEIGSTVNRIYERISGQPFGADIYDWLHPPTRKKTKGPCPK